MVIKTFGSNLRYLAKVGENVTKELFTLRGSISITQQQFTRYMMRISRLREITEGLSAKQYISKYLALKYPK